VDVVVAGDDLGIPETQIERVFTPFWRGDTAPSTPGVGLGLALAKRITEALGDDIQVDSPARGVLA
jgi:signal transduction histidine kinase